MDRCALFVDAGYALADGAMAVHGTRRRDSVSWDHAGLLKLLAGLARDRTGLPVLRCYWYETAEGNRTAEHDALAEMPGLKLRLVTTKPGRREGIESQLRRDLLTLGKNGAISDAFIASADEDLAELVAEVQDLGLRVVVLHIATDNGWTIPQPLRQECDDIVEISGVHLRPFVELIHGAEPSLPQEPSYSAANLVTDSNESFAGTPVGSAPGRNGLPVLEPPAPIGAIRTPEADVSYDPQPHVAVAGQGPAAADYQAAPVARAAGVAERSGGGAHRHAAPAVSAEPGVPYGLARIEPGPLGEGSPNGNGRPRRSPGNAAQPAQAGSSDQFDLQGGQSAAVRGQYEPAPGQSAAVRGQYEPTPETDDVYGDPAGGIPANDRAGGSSADDGWAERGWADGGRAFVNPANGSAPSGGALNGGAPNGGDASDSAAWHLRAEDSAYENGNSPGIGTVHGRGTNGREQGGHGANGRGANQRGMNGPAANGSSANGGALNSGAAQSEAANGRAANGRGNNGRGDNDAVGSRHAAHPGAVNGYGQNGLSNGGPAVPAQPPVTGPMGPRPVAQEPMPADWPPVPAQREMRPQPPSAQPGMQLPPAAMLAQPGPSHPPVARQAPLPAPPQRNYPADPAYPGVHPAPGQDMAASGAHGRAAAQGYPSDYRPQQYQYDPRQGSALPAVRTAQPIAVSLPDAVEAAHSEGFRFGKSVSRDAPGLWLEAVLARKPRMPSDLEARLLQMSVLPIDSLLHDEVRHSLRRGFWDALESSRR